MNNQNNNSNKNPDSGTMLAASVICFIVSALLFWAHSSWSSYDMNPLSFIFCASPAFLGILLLFFL